MKKKLILVVAIVLAMGITACSSNPKEEKSETETITGQKTSSEESLKQLLQIHSLRKRMRRRPLTKGKFHREIPL